MKTRTLFSWVVTGALGLFTVSQTLAGPGGGSSNDGFGYGYGQEKVTICHKPGTPAEKTMELPRPAIKGHMGHGDTLGPCPGATATARTETSGLDALLENANAHGLATAEEGADNAGDGIKNASPQGLAHANDKATDGPASENARDKAGQGIVVPTATLTPTVTTIAATTNGQGHGKPEGVGRGKPEDVGGGKPETAGNGKAIGKAKP